MERSSAAAEAEEARIAAATKIQALFRGQELENK